MRKLIIALFAIFFIPYQACAFFSAEVSDLSVHIERDKEPSNVIISGTMNDSSHLVAKVIGPKKSYKIVPKVKKLGMWTSSKAEVLHDQYSYYKIFSTNDLITVSTPEDLRLFELDPQYFLSASKDEKEVAMLNSHLIKTGMYDPKIGSIEFVGDHFYRFEIPITKEMDDGKYTISLYSFSDDRKLLDYKDVNFMIVQTTKWQKFKDLSILYPKTYAALCILLAILAGLIAGTLRNGAKQH